MKNAQVHRFHERVAISLPGPGPTVYLSPKEAQQVAKALNACVRDIGARGFVESEFRTTQIKLGGKP